MTRRRIDQHNAQLISIGIRQFREKKRAKEVAKHYKKKVGLK